MKLRWTKLNTQPDPEHGVPCSRSSHGLSLVGRFLILYGGEHIARTPLDESQSCWMLDTTTLTWKRLPSDPPQRVAHAQACDDERYVYIFGGRQGIAMNESPLDDLWRFDVETQTWTCVNTKGDFPDARSFHKMVCVDQKLYVFGGCGKACRLNDLFVLDLVTSTWQKLGTSLLRGRGGPNLLVLDKKLAVVAGFAGEETKDGHCYDLESRQWHDKLMDKLDGLRPRSVCVSGSFPSLQTAIIFGGEVDPSDRGHEGAGGFANDVVLLDYACGGLKECISKENGNDDSNSWPGERGWSASASKDLGGGVGHFYIFGGLAGDDENPQRLDDLWRLDLEK